MDDKINGLHNNLSTEYSEQNLQDKCALLEQQVQELTAKLNWYEQQLRISKQKQYGSSSEKTSEDQLSIFNEAEKEADPKIEEPKVEEILYKRRKQAGKREKMLEDLPVETIEYSLSEDEQICPKCGEALHEMSKEVRREIKVIPAQVTVVEHVRYTYTCRNCEKNDISAPIITAPMPAPVLPGSFVSPSMMAFVMNRKYVEAVPLYRQEQQFQYFGLDISRQTLANWMIRGSDDWLSLLYDRMREHLILAEVIHSDETTLQVLHEKDRKATSTSYMWMFRTGQHANKEIILYDYQTTRASKHPQKFLEGFKGYNHCDGYSGYNALKDVILVGCWAHAKRKYNEALTAIADKNSTVGTSAQEGLAYCTKLFAIEQDLADVTIEQRYEKRLEQSKPVLEAFLAWLHLKKRQVLPKSALGQAISYCINQWSKLEAFLLDGRLEISNNRAERAIKSFVIGRKNWLFCNTSNGAKASAVIYSVIETAKANDLSPFHYLTYLFETMPNIDLKDQNQLDSVLPWSKDLPDHCKKPQKQ